MHCSWQVTHESRLGRSSSQLLFRTPFLLRIPCTIYDSDITFRLPSLGRSGHLFMKLNNLIQGHVCPRRLCCPPCNRGHTQAHMTVSENLRCLSHCAVITPHPLLVDIDVGNLRHEPFYMLTWCRRRPSPL